MHHFGIDSKGCRYIGTQGESFLGLELECTHVVTDIPGYCLLECREEIELLIPTNPVSANTKHLGINTLIPTEEIDLDAHIACLYPGTTRSGETNHHQHQTDAKHVED